VLAVSRPVPAPFEGRQHRALRALVRRVLLALLPSEELARAVTIAVDSRLGREIPVSLAEMVETCLRLGVSRCCFDGLGFEWNAAQAAVAHRGLIVRRGCAVDWLEEHGEGATVHFKRYLSPRTLDARERRLWARLADSAVVSDLTEGGEPVEGWTLESLRALERARVIDLSVAGDRDVVQRLVSSRV